MRSPLPSGIGRVIERLVSEGADVVWLAGSWARGEQARFSDIDLGVIALGAKAMRRTAGDGYLVSVSFTTEAATRASFRMPGVVGGAIPGWRTAVLLHDPRRIGASIQEAARAWTWASIESETAEWVRRQADIAVELVLKMLNGRERADVVEESRQRAALVDCLVRLLSVQLRLMYDSESKLYGAVGDAMGERWRTTLREALGLASAMDPMSSACALFAQAIDRLPAPGAEELALVRIAEAAMGSSGN